MKNSVSAALNSDKIEDVVDELQHIFARSTDFLKIISDLGIITDRSMGQCGIADHGVHGRPYVVGHVGQKRRLGGIGLPRFLERDLEQFTAPVSLLAKLREFHVVFSYFLQA